MDKEVEDLVRATKELKTTLIVAVSDAIEKFRKDSGGYTPSSISIPLVDVSTVGSRKKEYVLGDITIRVDFL